MSSTTPKLDIKVASDIKGRLRIPSYQRGYRWEPLHVMQLLDDLKEHTIYHKAGEPYYLQPVVVAPANPEELEKLNPSQRYDFDLIDGQQRLTTLYLLFKAFESLKNTPLDELMALIASNEINKDEFERRFALAALFKGVDTSVNYEILYQTRIETEDFLKKISTKTDNDPDVIATPDHLYIYHAYKAIHTWINKADAKSGEPSNKDKIKDIALLLRTDVKIIWYELSESIESWKKFTDLNAGKIALTNAELVKALLLSHTNQSIEEYQQDIVVSQWDRIENDLADEKFWKFLTRKSMNEYPVKIDLIFDLVAGKREKNRKDEYYTFNRFQEILNAPDSVSGKSKWDDIYSKYLRLRDWYNDPWYYHRIGYLIAVGGSEALLDIFLKAFPEDGSIVGIEEFKNELEEDVADTLQLPQGVEDFTKLHYEKHYDLIYRILTLYNVMLCDRLSDNNVRYPFFQHNADKNGGWSLEHIHAQNSEELKGAIQWKEWVASHLVSLQRIQNRPLEGMTNFDKEKCKVLIARMIAYPNNPTEKEFKDILSELGILTAVKGEAGENDKHLLPNLALLSANDNSCLNKSTFDVKRIKIAKKISINYVPIGTERVFMKAIAGASYDDGNEIAGTQYACDGSQMFFWGDDDRKAYIRDIEEALNKYSKKLYRQPQTQTEDGIEQ